MSKRIITNYGTDIATIKMSSIKYNNNIDKYIRVWGNRPNQLSTYAVIIANDNKFGGI